MISLPFIAPFVRNKFVNQMPHESFACENKLTCLVINSRRALCSIAMHMLRTFSRSVSGYSTYESRRARLHKEVGLIFYTTLIRTILEYVVHPYGD